MGEEESVLVRCNVAINTAAQRGTGFVAVHASVWESVVILTISLIGKNCEQT